MKYLYQKFRICLLLLLVFVVFGGGNVSAENITIVTTTGKTFAVDAKSEETIADIKNFVFDVTRINPGIQRIYKGSVELENSKTIASYNIQDGDTLYVKRAAGGVREEDGGGSGFLKVLVIIVILFVVVIAVKMVLFRKETEEEIPEEQEKASDEN